MMIWQSLLLIVVSINTVVNCYRLRIERKSKCSCKGAK